MMKLNEVTWYSRLGALILFLAVVPTLCFYIGTQYELTVLSSKAPQHNTFLLKPVTSTNNPIIQDQSVSLAGIISTEKVNSPNSNYAAITKSDEQGDTEVYITDSKGNKLTPIFCGSFDSWVDNSKIKAFFPSECESSGYKEEYYYIHIDGITESVASSTFVPKAQ